MKAISFFLVKMKINKGIIKMNILWKVIRWIKIASKSGNIPNILNINIFFGLILNLLENINNIVNGINIWLNVYDIRLFCSYCLFSN